MKLHTNFTPKGDQPKAIKDLCTNLQKTNSQVLKGATGTGKTFTIANVINELNKKTLVLVHNKTLAGQLYSELKNLFPDDNVEYFISNFDYYQPEAFLPSTSTYIDKTSKQNQDINLMRSKTFNSLVDSKNTIVVASIACIFGAYDPKLYKDLLWKIKVNQKIIRREFILHLVNIGYKRNDKTLSPGQFSVKGNGISIMQAETNTQIVVIDLFGNQINSIVTRDYLNNSMITKYKEIIIYPGYDYIYEDDKLKESLRRIGNELEDRIKYFDKKDKPIEKQRIKERVEKDIENLEQFKMTGGIENYLRHLDLKGPGETPYTLIDYFGDDWLLIIDESHITVPQIHAMYNTDRSRKTTLVDYGFRLPSALDNRPLKFSEFYNKIKQVIYVSATPSDFEIKECKDNIVEQIIRPTGLLDPKIKILPSENQIIKIQEILTKVRNKNERCLILTLTIRMAEELSDYLEEQGFKVSYLHNELKTLERLMVINSLRKGKIDIIVGINLLREGLDIPEVSTIMILDADKEGFLRNDKSLIQIMGRASRNKNGMVYLFADKITKSIQSAMDETNNRRKIQDEFNKKNNIIPKTIIKPIFSIPGEEEFEPLSAKSKKSNLSNKQKKKIIKQITEKMLEAANKREFERAAKYRDIVLELENEISITN